MDTVRKQRVYTVVYLLSSLKAVGEPWRMARERATS